MEQETAPKAKSGRSPGVRSPFHAVKAVSLSEIDTAEELRFHTGMGELDAVVKRLNGVHDQDVRFLLGRGLQHVLQCRLRQHQQVASAHYSR